MRSIDQQFYNSKRWRKCKDSYLTSVNYLCERCLASGKITPARIVHHKTHLTEETVKDESLAFGFDNLEALCQDCHNKEHFGEKKQARYFFADGDLIF